MALFHNVYWPKLFRRRPRRRSGRTEQQQLSSHRQGRQAGRQHILSLSLSRSLILTLLPSWHTPQAWLALHDTTRNFLPPLFFVVAFCFCACCCARSGSGLKADAFFCLVFSVALCFGFVDKLFFGSALPSLRSAPSLFPSTDDLPIQTPLSNVSFHGMGWDGTGREGEGETDTITAWKRARDGWMEGHGRAGE